jgi:aminoglycoside phosphotransferase (APT) family kinase protein
MKVIASGRASEIFDLEDGRVLRRFKVGGDPEREALVMRHAADHGYPVPRVLEVTADALVLERVDGPTMLADLRRRPWRLSRHAALLAELHKRLHEIAAPQGVPDTGKGDRLLHLDLHPDNVLLSPEGPVVIDWTNARRGDPALDVALTWVIAATSGGRQGRVFLRRFLPHFDREAVLEALPAAAERRIADPNVTDDEREAVRRLVERHARR